jgi:hypothetical protein
VGDRLLAAQRAPLQRDRELIEEKLVVAEPLLRLLEGLAARREVRLAERPSSGPRPRAARSRSGTGSSTLLPASSSATKIARLSAGAVTPSVNG